MLRLLPNVAGAVLSLILAVASDANAAEFPEKPIRVIVPFGPGAATDGLGRILAKEMGERLYQSVLIENIPGAGGAIGAAQVARAAPDGYTMLLTTGAVLSTWAYNKSTPYDPLRDFRAVGEVARVPLILDATLGAPFSNFREMRAYAAAHPGALTYASPGLGTPVHIFTAYLFKKLGVEATHIPYKGGGQQLTDLISGQVMVALDSPIASLPLVKAKKVKPIFASKTVVGAAEIPSASDVGFGDFDVTVWYGLLAPSGVDSARIERLHEALASALQTPALKAWAREQGTTLSETTAAAFQATVNADAGYWKNMIKVAGAE